MATQKKELCFIIQCNYMGYGWEDESTYECGVRQVNYVKAYKEMKKDLQEYRIACPQCSYRWIKRYEPIGE